MAIEPGHKYAVVWVEADGSTRSVGFYFRKTAVEYAGLVKSVNNGRDVRIGFTPPAPDAEAA